MVCCCYTRRIEMDWLAEYRIVELRGGERRLAQRNVVARSGGAEAAAQNGFSSKKYENYSRRFPEGVQKEEIQQWRQARTRPGEKETHNIKLRETKHNIPLPRNHHLPPPTDNGRRTTALLYMCLWMFKNSWGGVHLIFEETPVSDISLPRLWFVLLSSWIFLKNVDILISSP